MSELAFQDHLLLRSDLKDHSHGGIPSEPDSPSASLDPLEGQREAERERAVRAAAAPPPPFVTAGGIAQPFKVLGEVHFDTVGTINLGAAVGDALLKSPLERAVGGATPTLRSDRAFEELLNVAVARWGTSVNAVINATYRAEHNGTVFADGLAVQFVTPAAAASPVPRTSETRLQELDALLKKGLISQKEFDKKRAQILNQL